MSSCGKNGIFPQFETGIQSKHSTVIQRIQSVLLFLAAILNFSVYFNALYTHAMNDPQQWVGILFAVLLLASAVGAFACIFLYASRSNQIRWVTRSLLLQVITLSYGIGILISLGGFGAFLWDETVGVGMLLLALCAQLYARKKIRDDEELVKSMDRIR